MLGDTAVAVHPTRRRRWTKAEARVARQAGRGPGEGKGRDSEPSWTTSPQRRQTVLPQLMKLRDMARDGRKVMLPLLNREIPLVADEWAKPELGSGCVKITPAHDPNDYDVGLRQNLPMVNILNPDGTLNDNAGPYQGLTVHEGPRAGRGRPGAAGPGGRRSRTARSSWPTPTARRRRSSRYLADQWFVKMERAGPDGDGRRERRPREDHPGALRQGLSRLAQRKARLAASAGSCGGDTRFRSGTQPTASEDDLQAGVRRPRRRRLAARRGARPVADLRARKRTWPKTPIPGHKLDAGRRRARHLVQLGPVAALDARLARATRRSWRYYYPTSVLITSRDIITLWVARMVLTGPAQRGRGAVPRGLHPPQDSRRLRRGDVEVEGQRRRSDRRDREVRRRLAALRPGLPDDRDAGHPHAGRVRVPALRHADRADQEEPRAAADQVHAVRQGRFPRNGPRSRPTRPCRAGAVVSERFELARNFCNKLWNAVALRADEPGGLHAGRGRRRTSLPSRTAGF